MTESEIAEKLYAEASLEQTSYLRIKEKSASLLFSIYKEISLLLGIGILLFTSGIGMLVYVHRASLGHSLILSLIAGILLGCAAYCYPKREKYSPTKIQDKGMIFNSLLVIGCLSLASFIGYLQYQFSIFGTWNEVPFLILAMVYFAIAYRFDSIAVLSLGITSLASAIGIVITPTRLLQNNDFSSERLIYTGLLLGLLISFCAHYLYLKNIKQHFTFTYYHFCLHLLFIAALAGLINLSWWPLFLLITAALFYAGYKIAQQEKSFYFLLCTVLYGYFAAGYFMVKIMMLSNSLDMLLGQFLTLYFIGSSVWTIRFLIRQYKAYSLL